MQILLNDQKKENKMRVIGEILPLEWFQNEPFDLAERETEVQNAAQCRNTWPE
jgi:hypothetical protein